MSDFSEKEPPTGIACPKCDGEKVLVTEDGTGVRGQICSLCNGTGIVTVSVMRRWKVAEAIDGAV